MTPPMLKSIHWNKSYNRLLFDVSWFVQYTADLSSLLDWAWNATPKWLLPYWNPSTGSKVTIRSCLMSADLYSKQLIWAHYWNGHEKLPQNDSSHDEIHLQNQNFCQFRYLRKIEVWRPWRKMAWLKMGWVTTKHHIWVIGVELSNTLHYQNFHWAADF